MEKIYNIVETEGDSEARQKLNEVIHRVNELAEKTGHLDAD